MITLYVEENNPITPGFYNSVLNNLQFHQLKCPCGQSGCLSVHGYYNRYVKTEDGKVMFRICRVKCDQCGHEISIYSNDETEKTAEKYGIEVLARLPLDPKLADLADDGKIEDADSSVLKGLTEKI